jgi:hypothetical protein
MEYNRNKYRIYDWKHFVLLHWILNPGLAFNELVLGQRVPKVMLEDKASPAPRAERSVIPCPHCNTLHDGRTWSVQNNTAYKNWFGLYCPACNGIIPCLTNALSFIILAVTFPLWGWFRKSLKEQWLKKQPARYHNIQINFTPDPFANKGWMVQGVGFGILMFLVMSVAFPQIADEPITWFSLAVGLPLWLSTGLLWGYIMKKFFAGKGKNNRNGGFIKQNPS